MSRTMAMIHQGTIEDIDLIDWIVLYNTYNGTSNGYLASFDHTNVALDLFESRAEKIVIDKMRLGYVQPRSYRPLIPDWSGKI